MRSFFNKLLFALLIILVLFGFSLAFLPSLLSTNWGKGKLEQWINKKIPGSIEVRELNLHWGKGQKIEGFILRDPEGQSVLGFEKLYSDASMWQILKKSTEVGFTRIKDFNAAIVTDQNGQSNLQKALGLRPLPASSLPATTISLSDVQGDFFLTSDPNIPFTGHLKGTTREGSLIGSFEIDIVLNGLNEENWSELQENADKLLNIENGKNSRIQAKIVNFPVSLLDQFLSLKGMSQAYFRPLLGEKLDVYLNKDPDPNSLVFSLTLLSPHLQGNLKGLVNENAIRLQEPALFTFDFVPDSINHLMDEKLKLYEPTRLELSVKDVQIPLSFFTHDESVNNCQYSFHIHTRLNPALFNFSNMRPLKINDFQLTVIAPACSEKMEVNMWGKAEEKEKPFEFHLESVLNKPKTFKKFTDQIQQNMHADLKVSHLPLILMPFKNQLIADLIGPYVDLQCDLKHIDNDHYQGSLALQSTNLQLAKTQWILSDQLSFTTPADLRLNIQPHALTKLFDSEKMLLNQSYQADIQINQLVIPIKHPEKCQLSFIASAPLLVAPQVTSLGEMKLSDMKIKGESKDQSLWEINCTFTSELLQPDSRPSKILYSPINWKAFSLIKINPNSKLEIPSFKLNAEGIAGGAEIDGHLNSDYIFVQNKPLKIYYRLTPKAFKEFTHQFNLVNMLELQSTSFFEFSLEPTAIDFKHDWLSKLLLKGTAHIDQMTLKDNTDLAVSMEKISIPLVVDARHNILDVSLQGTAFTSLDPKPNPFSMSLKVEQWLFDNKLDFNHTKTEFTSYLIALPTALISRFFTEKDLAPLLGNSLDVELKTLIDREKHDSGYWDMTVDGTSFHARTRLFLDENITLYVSKNPTAIVRWTITPEGYQYLQKNIFSTPTPLSIEESFTITAYLSALNFPLKFEASSIEEGLITAHLSTTSLKWKEFPSLAPLRWEGKLESEKLSKLVNLELFAKTNNQSPLAIGITLSELFDVNKKLNRFDQINVEMDVKARQLPAEFFYAMNLLDSTQMDKFRALWGDQIDAHAMARIKNSTGPIKADINGTNAKAHLKGGLVQGILKLEEPFSWSLRVTPLLGKAILAKNAPFLSTIIGSDQPIELTIDSKGFACPLNPFDINKVTIDKGTIHAGKVHFLNQGDINQILNYITPVKDHQMTIWFTPIFFHLQEGNLQMKRFDMLVAYLYTLAGWGTMDFKTHDFDLVLGLTAQSLNQAFAIQGLNEDYIFQVPVKGRKGRVEIDKTHIVARISALVAQMKGGSKGKILGGILEMALSDGNGGAAPEPTTTPFPWSNEWQHQPKKSPYPVENRKDTKNKSDKKKNKKDKVDTLLQFLDKI